MQDKVFCFWEGDMPAYVKLCMETWNFPYVLLDYDNVNEYTDLPIDRLKPFTLPQQADVIRAHVLRDQGGYWLDCDTIVLGDLPDVNMLGYPEKRLGAIGFLHAKKGADMFRAWAEHQKRIYMSEQKQPIEQWSLMGNAFVDAYTNIHKEITIGDISDSWPEDKLTGFRTRYIKYQYFYFEESYTLEEIHEPDLIMLHNSWTPDWYKWLPREEVLERGCTLSNFIREAIRRKP